MSTVTLQSDVRHIARFALYEIIGAGAFGTVWRARDPHLDRTVALKIPRTGSLGTAAERDRFLREAQAAAQLRHEGIVAVHEIGEYEGEPFIVSDFVEGVSLGEWLTAKSPTFHVAAEWMLAVSVALQYAHDHGVVHRDIKPSNIILDNVGRLYVLETSETSETSKPRNLGHALQTGTLPTLGERPNRDLVRFAALVDLNCEVRVARSQRCLADEPLWPMSPWMSPWPMSPLISTLL